MLTNLCWLEVRVFLVNCQVVWDVLHDSLVGLQLDYSIAQMCDVNFNSILCSVMGVEGGPDKRIPASASE